MILTKEHIQGMFKHLSETMIENKEWLIELDGVMGDSDLGLTMSQGFAKVAEQLEEIEEPDLGKYIMKLGMIFAQAVPSTMGTLVASGWMKAGKVTLGKKELTLEDFGLLLENFKKGIMERGKANLGEKTILDALHPATIAYKESIEHEETFNKALEKAYQAAEQGVEDTKKLMAVHGRAAYYQEKSIGVQDPGATVGMLIYKSIYETFNS